MCNQNKVRDLKIKSLKAAMNDYSDDVLFAAIREIAVERERVVIVWQPSDLDGLFCDFVDDLATPPRYVLKALLVNDAKAIVDKSIIVGNDILQESVEEWSHEHRDLWDEDGNWVDTNVPDPYCIVRRAAR